MGEILYIDYLKQKEILKIENRNIFDFFLGRWGIIDKSIHNGLNFVFWFRSNFECKCGWFCGVNEKIEYVWDGN